MRIRMCELLRASPPSPSLDPVSSRRSTHMTAVAETHTWGPLLERAHARGHIGTRTKTRLVRGLACVGAWALHADL